MLARFSTNSGARLHFKNMRKVRRWLKKLFGEFYSHALDAKILRLDCAIDVAIAIYELEKNLVYPRGRTVTKWRSNKKTTYLGVPPKETCIYQKAVPGNKLDYHREVSSDMVECTRIETRFFNKKVPITCLREIEKLREINPFEHLQIYRTKNLLPLNIPPQTRIKIAAFRDLSRRHGAQEARRILNFDRNFKRTVEKYIQPSEHSFDLHRAWKRRVRRFLDG